MSWLVVRALFSCARALSPFSPSFRPYLPYSSSSSCHFSIVLPAPSYLSQAAHSIGPVTVSLLLLRSTLHAGRAPQSSLGSSKPPSPALVLRPLRRLLFPPNTQPPHSPQESPADNVDCHPSHVLPCPAVSGRKSVSDPALGCGRSFLPLLSFPCPSPALAKQTSSFLLNEKCSTCRQQVSLLDLGTHVCASSPSQKSPPPGQSSSSTPSAVVGPPPRQPLPSQAKALAPPRPAPSKPASSEPSVSQGRRSSGSSVVPRGPPTSSGGPSSQALPRQPSLPQPDQQRRPSFAAGSGVPRPRPADDEPLPPPPNVFGRRSQRSGSQSSNDSNRSGMSSSEGAGGSRPSPQSTHRMPVPMRQPPPISHPSTNDSPLPSPPLNPWQLRPSSPALSFKSSSSLSAHYSPAASSFHTPNLSYSFERETKTPSPIAVGGGVDEREVEKIMKEAEAGGGAGRAGVGRRAFQLAAAQVMKERQVIGALGGLKGQSHWRSSSLVGGLWLILCVGSTVETFRPPTMPASVSPSTYSPNSPSQHSTTVPSPAFQYEHSNSSTSSPVVPGSVFSHAPSSSTSTSLSSAGQHRPHASIKDRPSFESQLDRDLSRANESQDAPEKEEGSLSDDDSANGGLGQNFLNLGSESSDSDDDEDLGPWKSSSTSPRAELLKAVGGTPFARPVDKIIRPASPPSSNNTHSSGHQPPSSMDDHTSSIRFAPEGRGRMVLPSQPMTPSSSMDHLAQDDLLTRVKTASTASKEGAGGEMEHLESMVDAMRQALTVSTPTSSDESFASPLSDSNHRIPSPLKKSMRRTKSCLRCGCEVGGKTGKRFVVVKGDEAEGSDGSLGGVLCETDWKELYLPKVSLCLRLF